MGSTRFPGKVMALLDGKPMIGHLRDELQKCKRVDDIVFAIPASADNAELEDYLLRPGQKMVVGSEDDVADRFWGALKAYPCDYFIRVCGDSPLVTAGEVDALITDAPSMDITFREDSDGRRRGQPQMMKTDIWLKALPFFDAYDREHVTTFFTRRLIVDTPEDLDYVERWTQFQKLIS